MAACRATADRCLFRSPVAAGVGSDIWSGP